MAFLHRVSLALALLLFSVAPMAAQTSVPTQSSGTQITTTAPVSSETTISIGTIAGQALTWAATAFTGSVGLVLTAWLVRLFKLAGIQATDQLRARLQEIIVNGLNTVTAALAERMRGRDPVVVKNAVVAETVRYVQAHGAETIQALGLDVQGAKAVEAIKARIETAITDPLTPTPAVLDPSVLPPHPVVR